MKVNSINNSQQFGNYEFKENFAKLSDNDLKLVAYANAHNQSNTKKHNKIRNLTIGAIPIVAGLEAALNPRTPKNIAKSLGSYATGASSRVLKGLSAAGSWASYIIIGGLAMKAIDKLTNKSEKLKQAKNNNPLLSTVATAAAVFPLIIYTPKAIGKVHTLLPKKTLNYINKKMSSVSHTFNNSKLTKSLADISAKTPASVKNIAKGALALATPALVWGGFAHSIAANNKLKSNYANNYQQMKDLQVRILQERMATS